MKRLLLGVLVAIAGIFAFALPAAGQTTHAAHHNTTVFQFLRDNNGSGGDLSPAAGSTPYAGEPVSTFTPNSGAWRWGYDSINEVYYLGRAPSWCLANMSPPAEMEPCSQIAGMVYTSSHHIKSNFDGKYLCSEGANHDAQFIKLTQCTAYRDTWKLENSG